MNWRISCLGQFSTSSALLERTFLSKKAASSQKKNHKYLGVVLSALTGRKKRRPFSISKRALAAASETAGRRRPLRPYFFTTGESLTWTPKTQVVSSATSKKSVFLCTVQDLEGASLLGVPFYFTDFRSILYVSQPKRRRVPLVRSEAAEAPASAAHLSPESGCGRADF